MSLAHLPAGALRIAVAGLLAVAALWAPPGVLAKCVPTAAGVVPWADAEAVFVGTVTSLANNDRWATVAVEEVWQGPDQPAEVVVRGGPADAATSVDRTYAAGARYVFAVTVEDGVLLDNACSGTTPADSIDLAASRPTGVRLPVGGTPTPSGIAIDLAGLAGPLAVAGIVGVLLATIVVATRRREA